MAGEVIPALKRQGAYIRHLRAVQNLSIEDFAANLNIKPERLEDIEEGVIETPDDVITQLIAVAEATEWEIYRFFGERYEALKESGLL